MLHPSTETTLFPFGKYKGYTFKYVAENDEPYLRWIINTPTMNQVWREAAQRTLTGESLDSLSLPKTKVQIAPSNTAMVLAKSDTVAVKFSYNPFLVAQFKANVDGREWDDKRKIWLFPVVHLPSAIKVFGGIDNIRCSKEVRDAYEKELQRKTELDTIRVKEDTILDIEGMVTPLHPYQKVCVEFVMRADGRALIADEIGLGKTAEAIGVAMHTKSKTLIICTASTVINWTKQIKKFTGLESTIWNSKGHSGKLTNQFHVINYDSVEKQLPNLLKITFDLMVCDEATYIKNRKTKRSKAILGYGKNKKLYPGIQTKYLLFLTGTPVVNRPIECFTLLNVIDKQRFNNWYHFTNKYGGWRGAPAKNLEELNQRTKDLIIRRTFKSVKIELPPKQRNDLYIELEASEYKTYENILGKVFTYWNVGNKPTVADLHELQQFLITQKLPRVYELIDEFLESGRNVVVFSCYKDPLNQIAKKYGKLSAVINGDMSKADRQVSIDRLTEGKARVGCISILAGGIGIDGLQNSISVVIFLDQYWTPAAHDQAEGRAHRQGQTEPVQVYYMLCENTIDEYMREILMEKQRIIDTIVDGQLVTESRDKSFFKEFIGKLNTVYKQNFWV